jgi:hypothetical protein
MAKKHRIEKAKVEHVGKPRIDMIGKTYNHLTPLECLGKLGSNSDLWYRCECDCPERNERIAAGGDIRSGRVTMCKECRRKLIGDTKRTHGMTASPEYKAWVSMKGRCYDSRNGSFQRYGGAGIVVCEKLRESFEGFLEVLGEMKQSYMSIERPNSKGMYSCGNCPECRKRHWPLNVTWAARQEQQRNMSSNRIIEYNGQKKCLVEWAQIFNIGRATIARRLNAGWSVHDALTRPVDEPLPLKCRIISANNKSLTIAQWAKESGLAAQTIRKRLYDGWPEDQAVLVPARP